MRTRLTDLLDIEHPIMLAGMGGVSYHQLVAAVSEAGGIGTFGASTMGPDELDEEIAAVKQLTSKPFGVDLLTALPGQVERGIQSVIAGGARIFVAGLDRVSELEHHTGQCPVGPGRWNRSRESLPARDTGASCTRNQPAYIP
jgi:enoyl-[acyl-carrier protein] reductase II